MSSAPLPLHEAERLRVLNEYAVLDTPAEPDFDDITELAAQICGTPIALITLVDDQRQWFKSKVGLSGTETSRDLAFCAHALNSPAILQVPDATKDQRFAANPLVTGEPHIRFYAGAPLTTPRGHVLGTLCVIDRVPRQLSADQQKTLRTLSRQVMMQLQLRRHTREMARTEIVLRTALEEQQRTERALRQSEQQQRELAEHLQRERERLVAAQTVAKIGSWETDLTTFKVIWSEETHRIFGTDPASFSPNHQAFLGIVHPDDRTLVKQAFLQSIRSTSTCMIEHRVAMPDGQSKTVEERWQVFRDDNGRPVRAIGTCRDITERKQAEAEIHELATRHTTTLESLTDGFFTMDREWRFTYLNREAERLFQMPRTELLGRPIFEKFPDARGTISEQQYARALRENIPVQYEQYFPPLGLWLDVRAFPSTHGLAVYFRDITEARAAREELARANHALRMLSQCNEALIHAESESALLAEICQITVATGGFRMAWVGYARDNSEKMIEPQAYAGEEKGYLKAVQLSWCEDHPTGQGPAARAIRSGLPIVVTDLTAESSGFKSVAEADERGFRGVVCLPLKEANRTFGVFVLYLGEIRSFPEEELHLLLELTDNLAFGIVNLHAREERLTAQKQIAQQAALLDKATDAIFVRDLGHRITYWNKGAELLYGWSSKEAVGKTLYELLPHDSDAHFQPAMESVLATGEWSGELQKAARNGELITVEARWTLLRDESGQPTAILAINTDITERKKLEAQFLRAQRMESIGTLAGGIAHDLNNLLAPIVMGVGLLKELSPSENSLAVLKTIERSAQRGTDLVKQVLSFARGVEGARVAIKLDHIVREIESIVENTFPKNIIFERQSPKELWLIVGDPTQLNQVILNLCVNARDAMPNGGRLTVSCHNVAIDEQYAVMNRGVAAGRYVALQVSDTGCGMPEEMLERIFEPFFTTKELGKGTGLGLSTVTGIVRSHGGFINVESETGIGSTFKIHLPAQTDATTYTPDEPKVESLPRGQGELILLVDDEASILNITKQTLEAFGYKVLVAEDGVQAIGLYALRRAEIGLVITDMMMPVMDGPALIVALRRINPQLRIIGASGLNVQAQVSKAATNGVKHFLAKPYSADAMLLLIRKVLTDSVSRPPL